MSPKRPSPETEKTHDSAFAYENEDPHKDEVRREARYAGRDADKPRPNQEDYQ
jgi:hypothetical protein